MDKIFFTATVPNGRPISLVMSKIDGFGKVDSTTKERGVIFVGNRNIEVRESYELLVRTWDTLLLRVPR